MPTPKAGYRLQDGTKVPGTTTIIGRFKDSGPLLWWANNEGLAGRKLYEKRDKAAEIGTIVHDLVERFLKGENVDDLLRELER